MEIKKKDGNFKTVWIRYDTSSSDRHQLFFKEHSIRNQEPEYPKGKTLFVLNIPPYATTESVKNAFTDCCGPVKSVTFVQSSNLEFKTAYIVFTKDISLKVASRLNEKCTLTLNTSKSPLITGIEKWCKQYNDSIIDESKVKEVIDKCLIEYDNKKEEEMEEDEIKGEVDSKGWTTITSKKKRGKFATTRKESTIQKIQTKEDSKKHKKTLLNFYTFQIRESKKEHLAELRKKFELDKKKLEQIKQKRIFKPF